MNILRILFVFTVTLTTNGCYQLIDDAPFSQFGDDGEGEPEPDSDTDGGVGEPDPGPDAGNEPDPDPNVPGVRLGWLEEYLNDC